ncbi:MAG: FAD/NAD(P)-binding protein [Phycisphaerales bacterium]|nr:FAD/NAD(P)-binding protein [Hyphomonadaceae bacterium]
MKRKRVAIVGAGFSGAALAAQLARAPNAPSVTLIERRARFGVGLAYSTQDPAQLLNVRASNMSVFVDEPAHFADWLNARAGLADAAFAPRKLYGAYVGETLRKAGGVFGKVKRVRGEAVACERAEQSWRITLAGGRSIEADAVVLALGHPPPSPHAAFVDIDMVGAWDTAALQRLGAGDVLLVGTGLTMVDAALALAARRPKGTIYAISRRGLIPRAHLETPRPRPAEPHDLPLELSDTLAVLRAEAVLLAARGEPWQQVMERMRNHTTAYWLRLPAVTQRRFLRHLRPWWDVHRHRMAPEIAARVAALQAAGRLRVLAGHVVGAERRGLNVRVAYRQRGGEARCNLVVAGVVNCTGGDIDLTRTREPLLLQLMRDGAARPHANGLGLDLDHESRLIDRDGQAHETLFALGPLSQGAFWESTAVPDIRVWAARIAAAVLN